MVHVPLMFLSEWREFSSAHCLAEKKLMPARVSMLLKSRSSPNMLPFSLCNKKWHTIRHMNRTLFPTTLLIPSYDIGKYVGAKDLTAPPLIFLIGTRVINDSERSDDKHFLHSIYFHFKSEILIRSHIIILWFSKPERIYKIFSYNNFVLFYLLCSFLN